MDDSPALRVLNGGPRTRQTDVRALKGIGWYLVTR
jgi:hypothetical protein